MIRFVYSKTSAGAVGTEATDPNTNATNPFHASSSADVQARAFVSTSSSVRLFVGDGTSLTYEVWARDESTGQWWRLTSTSLSLTAATGSTTASVPVGCVIFVRITANTGTVTKWAIFQDRSLTTLS